jgi:hypothetical protein
MTKQEIAEAIGMLYGIVEEEGSDRETLEKCEDKFNENKKLSWYMTNKLKTIKAKHIELWETE